MATKVFNDNVSRAATTYTVYPEEIVLPKGITGRKENTRKDDDIVALAHDIYTNGQKTPVLLRKSDAGEPVLVYGFRRVFAIWYANDHLLQDGENKIRVLARYENLTEAQAFKAAVSENRFRKDTSPVDDAHNINVFLSRFKMPLEEIAEFYFPEALDDDAKAEAMRWVKVRASLDELAPEAKQAVRDGEMKVTTAAKLAKLPKDQQREILAGGGKDVKGKKRITVTEVNAALDKKGPAKAEAPKPAAVKTAAPKLDHKTTTILHVSEELARAIDRWREDGTKASIEAIEKAICLAHDKYRVLVPLNGAEVKAA